jgi:hypothetical protein
LLSPLSYRLLADAVLLVHVALVLFVVLGLVLVLVGGRLRWQWVRSPWWRLLHLAAIGVVVAEAWLGVACPLTVWEMALREQAGTAVYRGSFIEHWLHAALFWTAPPWVFTALYSAFGLLVLASWFIVPPRGFGVSLPGRRGR